MKKFLLLLVLFASCKKDSDKENTTTIKVVDSITGTPVVGASLTLSKCGNLGCAFGSTTVFSGTTDNNGVVNVPSAAYQDISNELFVGNANYLPFEVQRGTTISLRPKGWLRLRLVKTGNYPADSRIGLNSEYNIFSILVHAPADSTVIMDGGGGVVNHVSWQVIDQVGQELKSGSEMAQVARLDTTNVTISY